MQRSSFFGMALLAAASLSAASAHPVLAVANSSVPLLIGGVESRPESGPVPLVDGDQIASTTGPVLFRMTGENRAVLGPHSSARIHPVTDGGDYLYLTAGTIQYEARKDRIAICAGNRLYVPSVPGSGTIAVADKKVQVVLSNGAMIRSGTEPCEASVAPRIPKALGVGGVAAAGTGTAGTAGVAGGVAGTAAAGVSAAATTSTITAAASAAGSASAGVSATSLAGVGSATAAAGATSTTSLSSQAPPSVSPIVSP